MLESPLESFELHHRARAALQQGRDDEAVVIWRRILALSPNDPIANSGLGSWALRAGDLEQALQYFEVVARGQSGDPRHWINVARVHERRGDAAAEEEALYRALQIDPQDLLALLMRGAMFERQGRMGLAADAFTAATIVAPPRARLAPELQPLVAYAQKFRHGHERRLADFIDAAMATEFEGQCGESLDRFRLSLEILLGRKRRYDSQPSRYFFPQLLPVEFLSPALFPWMKVIEAGTELIRNELHSVLRADIGLTPYIEYGLDQPLEQWAELNHSPRWSCYHLWKNGLPVPEHVRQCPHTVRLLEASPRPDQPGRTPVAMFSILKPHTAIPPHVGASNTRLVCHLPLIVPPNCSFRVGNTVREWVPGQAWVFDDTIEHEARNDSDELRVVLIWDTWHPALTPAERRMVTAMTAALNAFGGGDAAYGG